jgi:hypothetical protein
LERETSCNLQVAVDQDPSSSSGQANRDHRAGEANNLMPPKRSKSKKAASAEQLAPLQEPLDASVDSDTDLNQISTPKLRKSARTSASTTRRSPRLKQETKDSTRELKEKNSSHISFDSDDEVEVSLPESPVAKPVKSVQANKVKATKVKAVSATKISKPVKEVDEDAIVYSSSEEEEAEEEPEQVSIATAKQAALEQARIEKEEETKRRVEAKEKRAEKTMKRKEIEESRLKQLPMDVLEAAAESLDKSVAKKQKLEKQSRPEKARIGAIQTETVNKKVNFETATLDDLAELGFLDEPEVVSVAANPYIVAKRVGQFSVVPLSMTESARRPISKVANEFQNDRLYKQVKRITPTGQASALSAMTSFKKRGMGPGATFVRQ